MARVEVAKAAGACFGVERALELVRRAARDAEGTDGTVHTLGPLIHNPGAVLELESLGVSAIASPADARAGDTLVLRAHGVTPEVEAQARKAGLAVVDATCPFVKRVHVDVERLAADGMQVLVVGESGHPEVEGTLGHVPGAVAVGSAEELAGVEVRRRVGVVAQTTLERAKLRDVVAALVGRCEELRVFDTICAATSERQEAAAALARKADVMVVLGGRNSANTRHLAEICSARCARTHHVEDEGELEPGWFEGADLVGVTAGASTPATQIESACRRIRGFGAASQS